MGKIYRIIFVALVIFIPIFSIIGASNLIFRAPDLYKHEFEKQLVVEEIDIRNHEERLAQSFSQYMRGKEETFSFTLSAEEDENLFTANDQQTMEKLRSFLNVLSVIGGVAALCILVSCLFFRAKGEKPILRSAYRYSLIVFGMSIAAFGVLLEVDGGRVMGLHLAAPAIFGEGDLLPRLITGEFTRGAFLAGCLFSGLIMAILGYIIWKISKPRRMF
ncbi:MAG: hypothetical protein ACOX4U_04965 [Anaerovoracaceae bacterium]|jgi:ABC-type multidrug transport system fused ATPase/permease subunit